MIWLWATSSVLGYDYSQCVLFMNSQVCRCVCNVVVSLTRTICDTMLCRMAVAYPVVLTTHWAQLHTHGQATFVLVQYCVLYACCCVYLTDLSAKDIGGLQLGIKCGLVLFLDGGSISDASGSNLYHIENPASKCFGWALYRKQTPHSRVCSCQPGIKRFDASHASVVTHEGLPKQP